MTMKTISLAAVLAMAANMTEKPGEKLKARSAELEQKPLLIVRNESNEFVAPSESDGPSIPNPVPSPVPTPSEISIKA